MVEARHICLLTRVYKLDFDWPKYSALSQWRCTLHYLWSLLQKFTDIHKPWWKYEGLCRRDLFDKYKNSKKSKHLQSLEYYDCERAFSSQNHIMSPLRNRLSSEHTDMLMRVMIEGGDLSKFDFDAAVQRWRALKNRVLFRSVPWIFITDQNDIKKKSLQ